MRISFFILMMMMMMMMIIIISNVGSTQPLPLWIQAQTWNLNVNVASNT